MQSLFQHNTEGAHTMALFKKSNKGNLNPLSANGMIGFIKSNLKNPTEKNVTRAMQEIAKSDADQEHLTEEGQLPWGWFGLNRNFTEKIRGEYSYFLEQWLKSRDLSPKEHCEALESFVLYMKDVKKICNAKNECFAYWFDSVIATDEYIEKRTEELEYLKANLKQLQQEYEKKKMLSVNLDRIIKGRLADNKGILQADFVKLFDPLIQDDVKEILYHMDKAGELQRVKQGRSYILNIK